MTKQTEKRVAWAMMTGGIGAALLFVAIIALDGRWPRAWWMYLWPCSGLMLGVVGWVRLRRLYRAEPPQPPAAWTVTLTDLIIAMVFAGLCSAIFTGLGGRFERFVPAVGLTGFVFYVHGALAASLSAVFSVWRVPFVIANIGLTLGAMGWMTMGLMSVLIVGTGSGSRLVRFWLGVLFDWSAPDYISLLQVCLYALPIGAVLMAFVRWRMAAVDAKRAQV